MSKKVLITAPYFQPVAHRYEELFKEHGLEMVIPHVNERMSEEELLACVSDVSGILCGDDRITEKVLAAAPQLKTIVKWGTGIDSIDKEAASRRGIPVRNTLNAFTEPVADTIFAYILAFARNTIDLDAKIRRGIWEKKLSKALNECTIGIIGMGNIGKAVRKRAEAFGMRILATDIKEVAVDCMVPLETLLKEADFIVLCTDLNPTSHHLINKQTLALVKDGAYIINASRGPLIEGEALIEALQSGKVVGAGLDVFEEEPLPENHPFKTMPQVIMSPHNANSSLKAWERVHENSVRQLLEDLKSHE